MSPVLSGSSFCDDTGMKETISLTIDGNEVTVANESTILEAAKTAGIEIPTLCYLAKLRPIGSCRLCLVEVEGTEKPVTSCNTTAVDGMVVTTQSERLFELRKDAISYLLINHPLDCPVCDKGGECRLQDLAFEYGVNHEPYKIDPVTFPLDTLSPLVERNNNRCIRCGRCVAICNEIQGEGAIWWVDRGYDVEILPKGGYPLNCEFCGQCISVCPVGALTNRLFKYTARAWEMDRIPSVCPYCGGGCAIELNVRNNKILRVTSDDDATHNQGNLCGRGNFGFGFVDNPERLQTPLLKKQNEKVPSWKDAIQSAAAELKKIVAASGPASVAGLGSPRASNEDNYLFQKVLRAAIGTNNIDSAAHFTYRNLERGLNSTLGFPAGTSSITNIDSAQVIFVIGADVRAEMTPAALHIMRAARFKGAKLIVANPRKSKLDKFANQRLRYRPGTENVLVAGIAKALIENEWESAEFIEKNVAGYEDYKKSLEAVTVDNAAMVTGVPAEQIVSVAQALAAKERGCIIFGYDVFSHPQGADVVAGLADVAILTENLGKEGCGLVPVVAKNNMQGMLDMGIMPDLLPGYQALERKDSFEKNWGRDVPHEPGKNSEEILDGIENGSIRALYLMGCNPVQDFPEPKRWEAALKKLSWLVVQDVFPTEAADVAHYVFPAVTFAEKTGTFTSGERRVQKFEAAVEFYGNALPDWKILQMFAQYLDYPIEYSDAAMIAKEIGTVVPQYSGLRYSALSRKGLIWGAEGLDNSSFVSPDSLTLSFAAVPSSEGSRRRDGRPCFGDGIGPVSFRYSVNLCAWIEHAR